jgi:membrane associated rhomboid family serine protease
MSGRDPRLRSQSAGVRSEFLRQAAILAGIVALLWLLEVADQLLFGGRLDALGIQPRTATGLRGIALAPFLHGGFAHLAANTIPFIVLGWLVMLRSTSDFFVVAVVSAAVSGLGVWLFGGSHSVHVGLSGVIFGFLGYLLARGVYERRLSAILLALIALVLYGGALWGVLPLQAGVSWQGHLFGFLGGWLVGTIATRPGRSVSARGK